MAPLSSHSPRWLHVHYASGPHTYYHLASALNQQVHVCSYHGQYSLTWGGVHAYELTVITLVLLLEVAIYAPQNVYSYTYTIL